MKLLLKTHFRCRFGERVISTLPSKYVAGKGIPKKLLKNGPKKDCEKTLTNKIPKNTAAQKFIEKPLLENERIETFSKNLS